MTNEPGQSENLKQVLPLVPALRNIEEHRLAHFVRALARQAAERDFLEECAKTSKNEQGSD